MGIIETKDFGVRYGDKVIFQTQISTSQRAVFLRF